MKLNVATKLIVGFMIVIALAGVVGILGLGLASRSNQHARSIVGQEVHLLARLNKTIAHVNEVRRMGLLSSIAPSAEELDVIEVRITDLIATIEQDFAALQRQQEDGDVLQAIEDFRSHWAVYTDGLQNELLPLSRAGKRNQAQEVAAGAQSERFLKVTDSLDNLVTIAEANSDARLQVEAENYDSRRQQVIATLIAAIVIGMALALYLSRRLAGNLREVSGAAQALAAGDLTRRAVVGGGDETRTLADAFNAMAERLEQMVEEERTMRESLETAVADYSRLAAQVSEGNLTVRLTPNGNGQLKMLAEDLNGMVEGLNDLSTQVREGSQGIGAAGSQILAAATQHAAGASEQSAAIAEVASTVDEVRASAEQTAQKAEEVAQQAEHSARISQEGESAVADILTGMEAIREKVGAIAQDILALSEQTQQIGEITTTVSDIADQSNLLALNASIEAAKAGEQGKGFAVVAAEVRNLAEQSKGATEQVRTILGDIQKATNAAVLGTEEGSGVVESGMKLADRAGEVIGELAKTISVASQAVQQIAAGAHQQSIGIDQISQAMQDIEQATTQAAAGARQSQSSAESLDQLARSLQEAVGKYRV